MCDHKSRFIEFFIAAPGSTSNILDYQKTQMVALVDNLPPRKYIIGDAAYVCSEYLITPFKKDKLLDVARDSYNFYISQLRMSIEMAFGNMVNRWRILKSPLQTDISTSSEVLCV